jgi:uncharacterized LabA/DUF88 family protein
MNRLNAGKVAMLIDAENIELNASKSYGSKIDYKKLLQEVGSRELIRALYFTPQDKLNGDWERKLKSWGLEVKGTLKNCDCWLTISAVTLADKSDVVVLVGGDSDYLPLLWYLQSRGVKTEVWSWPECTSNELKNLADDFIPLTTDILTDKTANIVTITPNRRKRYA